VLTTLLNDLSIASDLVLVLDDYHVIDSRDVQDGMSFLLEHLPPQVHLVIASRADPALPLARLRARSELVEVRAADLRFTPDEAAVYLNETMGLQVRSIEHLQHGSTTTLAGDGIAQGTAHSVQDRGLLQERPDPVGLTLHHLLDQVVDDVTIVAGEAGNEAGNVVSPLHRT
jgi:hypothetical protein